MKKQNIFIKLLSLLLCITLVSPTAIQAASLSASQSVSGHWAEETLTYWDMLGLFDKIPDDEFGIDKAISRGAFVYLFNTMLGIGQTENTAHNFTDIAETDWNYADIVTAYNTGYISGYPDNTFRADSPITREEMCTIISRYFDLDKVYDDNKLQNFTDKEKIQSYALDHIGALAELETVNGYPDGSFKPQNNITYAEAVTIITRFLGYINGGSGVSGRIYYEGKPVYNAEITVYNHDTNEIAVQDTSDVYGDYILDTSVGMYDIVVMKNGTVSMISGVEVGEDTRTYNKIILEAGQYVTGVLADENEKTLAETEFYIKGDTYVTVVTDENGEFTVILPVDGDYVILAEVNGKLTEITEFRTSGTEDGLDLGTIVVSTGEKTAKTEGTTIKPPLWYLNSMIQDAINKDENDTEKDDTEEDDKTDEEETPEFDYSSLPYREPKTMAELVELNGGEQPYISLNDKNEVNLYIGRISDNKVSDVYDVITELNNVKDLFNIEDSRYEFIPYNEDKIAVAGTSYRIQQVYRGVEVLASDYIVRTDDNGYIVSILGKYHPEIRYSDIDTSPKITLNECKQIISDYYSTDDIEFLNTKLVIFDEEIELLYYCNVIVNGSLCNIMVSAVNGDVISEHEVMPVYDNMLSIYNGIYVDKFIEISIYHGVMYESPLNLANNNTIVSPEKCTGEHIVNTSKTTDKRLDQAIKDNLGDSAYTVTPDNKEEILKKISEVKNTYGRIVNHYSVDGKNEVPIVIFANTLLDKNEGNAYRWNNATSYTSTLFELQYDQYDVPVYVMAFGYQNAGIKTIGHEYTHAVQNNIVKLNGISSGLFGAGYKSNEQYSFNIPWLETWAIAEGTADIMGVLASIIIDGYETVPLDSLFYFNGISFEPKADDYTRSYQQMLNYYNSDEPGKLFEDGCYISRNNLPYPYGPGHNDRYICEGILYKMAEQGLNDSEILFTLWYKALSKLNSKARFIDLKASLIETGYEMNLTVEQIEIIKSSCETVGIYSNNNIQANMWYNDSLLNIVNMDVLDGIVSSENTYNPAYSLTGREYIQLIINFCNETDANITVTYNNGVATLTKSIFEESSHESISLIFDESKDILRWEAFIIAYRILNFCHAEFKNNGWIPLYNYSYEDKKAGTVEYEKFMSENQLIFDGFYTNNNYEEILEKYYDSMSYEDFHNSYMYVRNNTSDWQTSKYDFGESDTMTETHHIITTVIYNIYRSLGRDFNMITLAPDLSDVVFNEKMTLAHACYLLYSFIK